MRRLAWLAGFLLGPDAFRAVMYWTAPRGERTARIARERLDWLVMQRRDGGTWEWAGERTDYSRAHKGAPLVAQYRWAYRWPRPTPLDSERERATLSQDG